MGQLFSELKRRNVIRVGVAYIVASWVLLQVADLVLENIGAPDWVMQAIMLVLALGFPIAVIFSWAFELTPEGIKREKDVDRSQSITHHTARKLDQVTIGLLVLVLVMLGAERFLLPERPAATASSTATQVADNSIAVLAFSDMSAAGDQEYFAEGISEELLNALAQIPGLKVAGRTSSFAFKDQNRGIREIGEILEVAHVLEGSVRTQGERVRVTAQLVRADTGYHVFSKNYDRDLTDIFAVQDDIAGEIVATLMSTILGDETVVTAKATSVEAYEKYLKARRWIHTRDRPLMERSAVLLDEALAIDPDYAPALAQRSLAYMLLSNADGSYGDIPVAQALRMSRPLLDRAIELDPDLAEAHAILGLWHMNNSRGRSEEAVASLRRALAIVPTMANANNWLATVLSGPDRHAESVRLYEMVVEHDPLYRPAFNNLTFTYLTTRNTTKAEALIRRVERITGTSPNILIARGGLAVAEGRLAEARRLLREVYEYNRSASVVQDWYRDTLLALGDYGGAADVAARAAKLLPLELAGRSDEAREVFDGLELLYYNESDLTDIGDWMLLRDRPAEFIAFLEEQAGDDDWIETQPNPDQIVGALHLSNVAYALQIAGRDGEAKRVLAKLRETLDAHAHNGADNTPYWLSESEYAALTGDFDAMLAKLEKSVAAGNINIAGFPSPHFDRFREQPGFTVVEQESIRRANEERLKLGLPAI